MKNKCRRKVFLVGLDGATFDLILPWVKEGVLPNFARILKQGSYGVLESILPPLTTPAWASFITGRNPGKHGVFDFAERRPGSYDIKWVTSRSRKGRSLWKIVNSYGGQVVVINIPNNYPLEQVNGCMVAWMDSPGIKRDYAYPSEIIDEIEDKIGDYIITVIDWKENEDPAVFRNNLHRMIEKRAELTLYLMENKRWDFFAVLFSATDVAQHCFWSYADPSHPCYNVTEGAKYGETIKEVYVHIDRVLGEIQSRLNKETALLLMSDHGFGPLRYVINLNRWLQQEGWLTFRETSGSGLSGKIPLLLRSILTNTIYKTLSILKRHLSQDMRSSLKRILPGVRDKLEGVLFSSLFDWKKTNAYSLGSYGNIYINLRNREPDGIVEEGVEYETLRDAISSRLFELRDPVTGKRVVKRVYRREEIYHGPFLSKAPDLVVHWSDDGYHSVQRFGKKEDSIFSKDLHYHLTNIRYTGYHRLEGIFAIKGEGIRPDTEIKGSKIIDIAPTVLYLLGLPVPEDMDGRVLKDVFLPEYLQQNPIKSEKLPGEDEITGSTPEVYDKEESKKIAERLKNLGYID